MEERREKPDRRVLFATHVALISFLRPFSEISSEASPSYLRISLPARSDGRDNAHGPRAGASLRTPSLSRRGLAEAVTHAVTHSGNTMDRVCLAHRR